jgi:hypothetical protein
MVSVLASSVIDCGYELRSCQTKEYKIGICCFSAKNAALRRKNKDWLARNQNNVSEWSDISTQWLLLAHLAKGNVSFYHHLARVVRRLSLCGSLFLFYFYFFFNQNFLLSFNILFENKNESKTIRVTWYLYKQWEFLLLFKHSLNIAIIQLHSK